MSLVLKNISKSYGAVQAIRHADLSVTQGEIRAILGGNGSGKSTLAKIIGGVIKRNSGEILYDDKEINYSSPKEAKTNKVIITSQELSLFPNLDVEENICICDLPRKHLFVDEKEIKEKALNILAEMQLKDLIGIRIAELSPNKKYMIELAKAIVQEPQILIIDEITSALYRRDVEIVHDQLQKLKRKGCIILFISHRMEELYKICDSVTIMRNGETIGTFLMQEKTENEFLSLMVGRNIDLSGGIKPDEGKNVNRETVLEANNIPIPSYSTSIDLQATKGEIIGIAGLQGHGQSDLLRSLYGESGPIQATINGEKVLIHNPNGAVLHGIALLSGDREKEGTFSERNLKDNLEVIQSQIMHNKINNTKEILNSFGIYFNNVNQKITELSGGNQQKVIVARWLISNPVLLLADDPTKGIDVKARYDLHKEFVKIASTGSVVIFLSSDDEELVDITSSVENSRIIVMYEGKISAELKGKNITTEKISAASMPRKEKVN